MEAEVNANVNGQLPFDIETFSTPELLAFFFLGEVILVRGALGTRMRWVGDLGHAQKRRALGSRMILKSSVEVISDVTQFNICYYN